MSKIKSFVLIFVLTVLTLFFLPLVMNNHVVVDINTIVGDVSQAPLGQALLAVFVLGCLVGFFIGFLPISAYYWKIRRLEKQVKRLSNPDATTALSVSTS